MTVKSVLIAGDSHVMAMGFPLRRDPYEEIPITGAGLPVFGLAGHWPRERSVYWSEVAARAADRIVAIVWRGSQHFHYFAVEPLEPFDFLLLSRPDLPVDATRRMVPEAAVVQLMRMTLDDLAPVVADIKAAGGIPLICGTPPPKGDYEFMMQAMLREGYFQRAAVDYGIDLDETRLSPPMLLLKFWIVMQEAMQDFAARHGVAFLPVPADAQTEQGFLRPECYAPDATHANDHYGQLMVGEIGRVFSSLRESEDGA